MTLQTLVVTACLAAIPGAAAAEPAMPRVRANGDAAIAALIEEGTGRSTTIRRLIAFIDASDGIVYVERGVCGHGVRACLLFSVVAAGPYRVLRIVLDTRRDHNDVLGAIGHELQHAVEVLGDRTVRSTPALFMFYQNEGLTHEGRFETEAAIKTGLTVLNELAARAE